MSVIVIARLKVDPAKFDDLVARRMAVSRARHR
jgi:hypothetical protein